jgi:hypothetical protein
MPSHVPAWANTPPSLILRPPCQFRTLSWLPLFEQTLVPTTAHQILLGFPPTSHPSFSISQPPRSSLLPQPTMNPPPPRHDLGAASISRPLLDLNAEPMEVELTPAPAAAPRGQPKTSSSFVTSHRIFGEFTFRRAALVRAITTGETFGPSIFSIAAFRPLRISVVYKNELSLCSKIHCFVPSKHATSRRK